MLHITPTKKRETSTKQLQTPVLSFVTHPSRPLLQNHALQVSVFSAGGAGVTHTWMALQRALLCPRHIGLGVHQ